VAHVGLRHFILDRERDCPCANQGNLKIQTKRIENESGAILFHKRPRNPRPAALQTKDLLRAYCLLLEQLFLERSMAVRTSIEE
jgi:hypothetical protein